MQYRFDCGEGEGLVRLHNLLVNDGKWHEIIVERKGAQVTVVLDRKHRSGGFAPGSAAACARLRDDLYFGGEVKKKKVLSTKRIGDQEDQEEEAEGESVLNGGGFIGCLDNILFNGQQVPFHSSAAAASKVVTLKRLANVEFSCNFKADTGACRLAPCQNGGTCTNEPEGGGGGGYSCSCVAPRYGGRHCEVDTRPCDSSPCLNGGVCLVEEAASCEEASKSSSSGSSSSSSSSSSSGSASGPCHYKCECGAGFTGSNCQHSRYCTPSLCHNGGVCEESTLGPRCHCHSGWHGLYCQTDIDECSLSTPTCNAPATCINLPGTFRCLCPVNSTVPCSGESLLPSNITAGPLHITREELLCLVAVIALLGLLALLCVCCWNCRNRSRKKPNSRTPKNKHQQADPLLKNQANACIYENFNGNHTRNSKTSNMEMSTLANNVLMLSQSVTAAQQQQQQQQNQQHQQHHQQQQLHQQRPTSYSEFFNYEHSLPTALSVTDEFDPSAATLTSDPNGLSYKKAAPIASVSPQLVESKRSPKNIFKQGGSGVGSCVASGSVGGDQQTRNKTSYNGMESVGVCLHRKSVCLFAYTNFVFYRSPEELPTK